MRNSFLRGCRLPCRWLRVAAYYVSILLVFSFICCEVLDLDGSDFPVPSKSPRVSPAESQDLRRTTQAGVHLWGVVLSVATDEHTPLLRPDDVHATGSMRMPLILRSRLTLPRAAPEDPAATNC